MKPSTEAMVRMDNLRHFFQRGPGGSTVYACRCGAQEKYTSADTICGRARDRAVRFCLVAFDIPFDEDMVACKGGKVVRFLIEQPARFGPGKEAFAPMEEPAHSLRLWDFLSEASKHFIRWRMAEHSGTTEDRLRENLRLVLSQAAYEAQDRKEKAYSRAFGRWLDTNSPSGDVDQVQYAWERTSEYEELQLRWEGAD